MARTDPHPVDHLSDAADRILAPTAGVVDRVRVRRDRRRQRRRTFRTAGAVAVVLAAGAAAIVVPRLGDDPASEVLTADVGDAVVLPTVPSQAVAVAADGRWIWVLAEPDVVGEAVPSTEPATLLRVDADTLEVSATTVLPTPADKVVVTDGAVWVTGFQADSVLRIDPGTAAVVTSIPLQLERSVGCEPNCSHAEAVKFLPNAMAVAGGRVWVSTTRGEAAVIDPATDTVIDHVLLTRDGPGAAVGTEEDYWVTESWQGVVRVDADTAEVVGTTPIVVDGVEWPPVGIQAAGDHLLVTVADPESNDPATTNRTVVLDAMSGEMVDVLDRTLGGVALDGDDLWLVDGDTLRRVPASSGDVADRDVGSVNQLGLARTATASDGAYWYLPDARTLARVSSDAQVQTVEVVADPGQEAAPVSACPAATHPTGPTGPDALPPAGSTDLAVVQDIVDTDARDIEEAFGATAVRVVPRDGFVWRSNGDLIDIVRADDWQIEAVLPSVDSCPDSPNLFNGSPITFAVEPESAAPDDAAGSVEDQAEIEAVFLQWLSSRGEVEPVVAAVQGGEALRPTITEAIATAPQPAETYSGVIDVIDLLGPDRARVAFRIVNDDGAIAADQVGAAVRVDGRWLVSREAYCAALAIGPLRCPPE